MIEYVILVSIIKNESTNLQIFSTKFFNTACIVFDLIIKNDIEKLEKAMLSDQYMSFCKLKITKNDIFLRPEL